MTETECVDTKLTLRVKLSDPDSESTRKEIVLGGDAEVLDVSCCTHCVVRQETRPRCQLSRLQLGVLEG